MLLHTVLFWLRDDLAKEEIAAFEKELSELRTIKTTTFFYIGKPSSTRRPVIDHSYSYKLVVGFDGIEGHDYYQEIDTHQNFIKKCSAYWEKVQVYDADQMAIDG